ncbi:hypothetical protein ACLB2K_012139 [Fragaria x ananassa]
MLTTLPLGLRLSSSLNSIWIKFKKVKPRIEPDAYDVEDPSSFPDGSSQFTRTHATRDEREVREQLNDVIQQLRHVICTPMVQVHRDALNPLRCREGKALKLKDDKISNLEEQLRNLMLYLETGNSLPMSNGWYSLVSIDQLVSAIKLQMK